MISEACAARAGLNAGSDAAWRRSALLTAIGCLALALGTVVYLTDRSASHAMGIPAITAFGGGSMFGALGQWLPSFVHPFSFSLLTAAALPDRSATRYGVCVFWGALNLAFEIGQHPLLSARLAEALHDVNGAMPLARYFAHGTFDPHDIAAAVLGSLAAGVMLELMHRAFEKSRAR